MRHAIVISRNSLDKPLLTPQSEEAVLASRGVCGGGLRWLCLVECTHAMHTILLQAAYVHGYIKVYKCMYMQQRVLIHA